MLIYFKELSRYSLNSGFSDGQYNTLKRIGLDLGKKVSIKILSILQLKLGL